MLNIGFIEIGPEHFPFLRDVKKNDLFHISLIFNEEIDSKLKDFSKKEHIPITDKIEDMFLPEYNIKLLIYAKEKNNTIYDVWNMKPPDVSLIDLSTFKILEESLKQRIQLEKRIFLMQKYETIGTLVSGICHEINNILMIIMGYAQLAYSKANSNIQPYISGIISSCRRASDLIHQLQSFKSDKIEKRKVNLIPLIKETIKFIKNAFPENITISLYILKEVSEVEADLVSLRHAILNILTNAQEAMPNGGNISVRLYNKEVDEEFCKYYPFMKPGEYVCISIKDEGIGIPEEIINRIFDPFFTTKDLGRGIGLSYTYGIIKQHNGYILVDSKKGEGTEVNIYLPAIKKALLKRYDESLPFEKAVSKTILIVEDEVDLLNIISEFLEDMGYNVLKAYNAKDALRYIDEKKDIDILITDKVLPDLSGYQIARFAKNKRSDIKTILITGYESAENEFFDLVIQKPVSIKELAYKIRKLDRIGR